MDRTRTRNRLHVGARLSVPSPLDALFPLLLWLRQRRRRREVAGLLDYDDALLADMGVTRDDVRTALLTPGDASRNLHLAARARSRARRRRCAL